MWRACRALRSRKSGDNGGTEGRTRITQDNADPRPHPSTSLPECAASRTRVTSATSSSNRSLPQREGTVTPSCAEPPWSQLSLLWGRDAQHRIQPLRTADPRPLPLCKAAERPPTRAPQTHHVMAAHSQTCTARRGQRQRIPEEPPKAPRSRNMRRHGPSYNSWMWDRATQRSRHTGSAVMNKRATRDDDPKKVAVTTITEPRKAQVSAEKQSRPRVMCRREPVTPGRAHRSRPLKKPRRGRYCPARPR